MEIYIKIDNNSLSIPINDPFRLELDSMIKQINAFASAKGTNIDSLDIKGLVDYLRVKFSNVFLAVCTDA